jgi:peroxiredoxin
VKLQSLLGEQDRGKTVLLAVSPDQRVDLEKMAQKVLAKAPGELRTLLLSDPDLAVIKRYGLLNEAAAQKGQPLPHPATYVIDAKGVVRWKFVEVNYRVRPTNEVVLEQLGKIGD